MAKIGLEKIKIMQEKALIGGTTERSEDVPYQPLFRCICGHSPKEHHPNVFPNDYKVNSYCIGCGNVGRIPDCWHDFKLDNLSYIEAVAAEKGLI